MPSAKSPLFPSPHFLRLFPAPPLTRWHRFTNISCAPLAFKGSKLSPVILSLFLPPHPTPWTTRISVLVLSTSSRMPNNFGRVSAHSVSFPFLAKLSPIELEDILHLPTEPSLDRLDSTLKRFVSFCASYYGTPFHYHRLPRECSVPNMQQSNTFKPRCKWSMRVSSCSTQNCSPSTRKGCVVML